MNDDLQRMVGEMNGKLDSLIAGFNRHIAAHDARHLVIDQQVQGLQAEINQSKGRRGVLVTLAGIIGGLIVAAADRLFKGG